MNFANPIFIVVWTDTDLRIYECLNRWTAVGGTRISFPINRITIYVNVSKSSTCDISCWVAGEDYGTLPTCIGVVTGIVTCACSCIQIIGCTVSIVQCKGNACIRRGNPPWTVVYLNSNSEYMGFANWIYIIWSDTDLSVNPCLLSRVTAAILTVCCKVEINGIPFEGRRCVD